MGRSKGHKCAVNTQRKSKERNPWSRLGSSFLRGMASWESLPTVNLPSPAHGEGLLPAVHVSRPRVAPPDASQRTTAEHSARAEDLLRRMANPEPGCGFEDSRYPGWLSLWHWLGDKPLREKLRTKFRSSVFPGVCRVRNCPRKTPLPKVEKIPFVFGESDALIFSPAGQGLPHSAGPGPFHFP